VRLRQASGKNSKADELTGCSDIWPIALQEAAGARYALSGSSATKQVPHRHAHILVVVEA
jgi:hypothetical protein